MGAGFERRRAETLAEAQRSPLGAAEGHGTARRPAEDGGEVDPGSVLNQIKAAHFKDKGAVKSEPLHLSINSNR